MSRIPNLFLVGAPKSGTSAIWRFLKQHPDIWMTERKEIFPVFDTDLKYHIPAINLDDYRANFKEAGDQKIVGEANVFNLVSKEAALRIKEFSPDARILIMLRNPIEMAWALHGEQVFNGNEPLTFEEALESEPERRNGKGIPKGISFSEESLCYTYMASYFEQVKRYLDVFGRENVQITLFKDFQTDNAMAYQQILRFLEVNDLFQPEFKIVNPSQEVRSKRFRRFMRHLPEGVRSTSRVLIPHKPTRKRVFDAVLRVNSKEVQREEMTSNTRTLLKNNLSPDVRALEKLLEKDLSAWK